VGLDNLSDYYDVSLKKARLKRVENAAGCSADSRAGEFHFVLQELEDRAGVESVFNDHGFDAVINMAAQAGVRYSLENPRAYIDANVVGFLNVLEGCRHHGVEHLVYASSSSIYGANEVMPFRVSDNVDHPVSLYAASKKSNELMAHSYSYLFDLPTTALRFFTVYGPWSRPDMALFKFTRAILAGQPIDLYNHGKHSRDFTYIDDIVEGVLRVLDHPAEPDPDWSGRQPSPASSKAPWRVYNIGSNNPVMLEKYVEILEKALGREAIKNLLPIQPGDLPDTYADVSGLEEEFDFKPATPVEEGVKNFVAWYRDYYQV
jgi:UDP-glucuronate 4-epimerase